jgi:cephalosporin hydroxylase
VAFLEDSLELSVRELLSLMQDRLMTEATYFGIRTLKSPLDLWIYQEILCETQPDVIVEIGNFDGGSTLALAHLCDHIGKGRVIGLDLCHSRIAAPVRSHPRIELIEGDACASFEQVAAGITAKEQVLIIEDSSHTYENTLAVLETYSDLVKAGGYFIVEDGICHHGLDVGPSPGPYEAVDTFVQANSQFVIDRSREGFVITWNPKGYLRRLG